MSPRKLSAQAVSVLGAFVTDAGSWRHGYAIAQETGLKAGTLYPILIRLAERGLVEAQWEDGEPAGRPRRHLYRLTSEGLDAARVQPADNARRSSAPGGGRAIRRPSADGV